MFFSCYLPLQVNILFEIVSVVSPTLYLWLLSFRGFSTFHALVVAVASLYLLLLSDLFDEGSHTELIITRRSTLSDTILAVCRCRKQDCEITLVNNISC